MRASNQKNKAAHLRRSAALAIGKILRDEYETMMPADVPARLRDLIAWFDESQREGEATAAQKRK